MRQPYRVGTGRKLAHHRSQPPYCAETKTEAQRGPETCQGHPAVGGRALLAGASPLSVRCVFRCSVVRFKNGQGSNLDGGNYHVYENGSLEIEMIRKEDQGIYTCVATNILGKAENQVRLEVKGKGEVGRERAGWGRQGSCLLKVIPVRHSL